MRRPSLQTIDPNIIVQRDGWQDSWGVCRSQAKPLSATAGPQISNITKKLGVRDSSGCAIWHIRQASTPSMSDPDRQSLWRAKDGHADVSDLKHSFHACSSPTAGGKSQWTSALGGVAAIRYPWQRRGNDANTPRTSKWVHDKHIKRYAVLAKAMPCVMCVFVNRRSRVQISKLAQRFQRVSSARSNGWFAGYHHVTNERTNRIVFCAGPALRLSANVVSTRWDGGDKNRRSCHGRSW